MNSLRDCCILHAGKNLKEALTALEEDLVKLNDELQQEAQRIPNMTHPDVPIGGEDCSTTRKLVFQLLQFPSSFLLEEKHCCIGCRSRSCINFFSSDINASCDFLGWQPSQI